MGNLVFQATLGGQVNLVGPNTASTYNINVPAVAGTLITTGDTGTVSNTMLANSTVTIGSTSVSLGGTATTLDNVNIGTTTPASGKFTSVTDTGLTSNRVTYAGASGVLQDSSNLTFDGTTLTATGNTVISSSGSTDALRITQTGTGNALLVEDSANPDSTPFVVDTNGGVIVGNTTVTALNYTSLPRFQVAGNSQATSALSSVFSGTSGGYSGSMLFGRSNGSLSSKTVVASGDDLGRIQFEGYDGTAFIPAASVISAVDGTPGTNDMPGRLVFSTTADGASSPTERMRIDSAGAVGIGGTAAAGVTLQVSKNATGSTNTRGVTSGGTIQSDSTASYNGFRSSVTTASASFTLADLSHFVANQNTLGAGSTVTAQYGFNASSTLTGATNNYGFYGNIASGTGRYNFYAAGTAANYFAGDMQFDKTVTAAGTTGAQTINKNAGTVNFAAAATSLVVTDSRVTTSSIIIATVGTNDTTMKSVSVVAGAGSFTLYANVAATAETRVNFLIIN